MLEKDIPDDPIEKLTALQNAVIAHATDGPIEPQLYTTMRREIISNPKMKALAPRFIQTCRDLNALWEYMKRVATGSGSYAARREHIYSEFQPLFDYVEQTSTQAGDVSEALSRYNGEGVREAWEKALERRATDPEGAITSARTLLEEVCKHIIEDTGEPASPKWDLPKLYSEVSKVLNLAPSQHTEETFKKILGGCHTVVENLGSLRNKMGDAHASGRRRVRPSSRHAALAVNLAGAMAMFLIETSLHRSQSDFSNSE